MGMFGMDDDYWEEYHTKMHHSNLKKGNVGEHPNRWGGLPQELFPGYESKNSESNLDNYEYMDYNYGRVIIRPWETIHTNRVKQSFVFSRKIILDTMRNIKDIWVSTALELDLRKGSYIEFYFYYHHENSVMKSGCETTIGNGNLNLMTILESWNNGTYTFLETVKRAKETADKKLISLIGDT